MRLKQVRFLWILGMVLTLAATPGLASGLMVTNVSPDEASVPGSIDRNASWGGRVQNLAIDPSNDNIAYAATEWGGLYKTIDGGNSWFRLDNHLPNAMYDVAVDPGNTGTIYATSYYDGKQVGSVSGIQVSYDGGATWTHPATATPPGGSPCPANQRTEPSAYGIGIRPDAPNNVFIGTNCGVAISTDSGLTWTHVVPTSSAGVNSIITVDVVAQAGGIVDTFGAQGHTRSTNNGGTWSAVLVGAGALPGSSQRGSIAANPLNSNILFAGVGRGGGLWETDNGGTSWTQIEDTASNRTPFVSTNPTGANSFDLWYGDGVDVHQVGCNNNAATPCGTASLGDAVTLGNNRTDNAHDDATDIEFRQDGCAWYFSSDGGVYRNDNCPGDPGWERAMAGIRAHWVFGFDGSEIGGPATGLHFGVQDDGVWASPDAGGTWNDIECCDGFDNVADSDRTVYTVCCGLDLVVADADDPTSNSSSMPMPPGTLPTFNHLDAIDQFGPESYVAVTTGAGGGVFVTTDEGSNWAQIGAANTPANVCGVQASVSLGTPIFYVKTTDCNGNAGRLFRYSGTAPGGSFTAADTGLTGVGVFAVDEVNPNRLYASDLAATTRMVFSNNGGTTWQPDTALDLMMQGGNVFEYTTTNGPTSFHATSGYSQPSLVAFDPADPMRIVAAGIDSGVFASTNGGQTWSSVADFIPRAYHAYFDSLSNDFFVATQGRGVWRIALPSADLRISKSDSPDPVNAGEQLYYTIHVTNDGPDDATDVIVVDTLPAQTTFITDDMNVCTEGPTDTLTCELGDIDNGETVVFVIKVKVDSDTVVNAGHPTGITNEATVTAGGVDDPDLDNNTDSASTIVEELADLRITKICKPDGPLPANEPGFCDILVDNFGPSDARDVTVIDVLSGDGPFSITSVTSSQGVCGVIGTTVTCNLGVIEAASTSVPGRATIRVNISAAEATDINDVATVSALTPDPDVSNNQAVGSISVFSLADLSLTKSDAPDPVVAGTNLVYTLTVTNSGPSDATNVVVTDDLPAGVEVVSVTASGGGTCNAGVPGDPFSPASCAFNTIPDGSMRTMTITVLVLPETIGLIQNDARVGSETADDNNANDLATAATTVVGQADVEVTKEDLQDPVLAGEILDYRLTVINNGPSTARNVVVTDDLPQFLTFVSATIEDGSGTCTLADPPTNTVECHIGEVPPNTGTPVFIAIKTLVMSSTPAGQITNLVTVASTGTPDPNPANNSTSEATQVNVEADLSIHKISDRDTYAPSSQIVYTVTVTNLGPSDAHQIVVTDQLPLDAKKVPYIFDTMGCLYTEPTHTLVCQLGTIAAGQSRSFNIHVRSKGNLGEITNTAQVASATPDPDSGNNVGSRVVLVRGGSKETTGGTTPSSSAENLEATAVCSFEDPSQVVVTLRWTPSAGAMRNAMPQRVEISPIRLHFERRANVPQELEQVKHVGLGGRARSIVLSDLKGAMVYTWRVTTKGKDSQGNDVWIPSDVWRFETPGCASADDMIE